MSQSQCSRLFQVEADEILPLFQRPVVKMEDVKHLLARVGCKQENLTAFEYSKNSETKTTQPCSNETRLSLGN